MQLTQARVVLTGAAGGIGQALAWALAARGARLVLAGRRAAALEGLAAALRAGGAEAVVAVADVTEAAGREQILATARQAFGGLDILINNAGISDFTTVTEQEPAALERLLLTNTVAPLLLTRAALPALLAQGRGQVVNIGSVFGSIAFPCFAGYSASKFALRGFSEALRRELDGSGVTVTYAAPRGVRTSFNPPALHRLAAQGKMTLDAPEAVAAWLVAAIERDRKEVYPGFPESLFVRLNALLPRLVDKALRRQGRELRAVAEEV